MNAYLHSIYQTVTEDRPNWFSFTPEWKRLSEELLDLEQSFLPGLDPESRAFWEDFQSVALELEDLDREGYFYYALALGIELGRLSTKG